MAIRQIIGTLMLILIFGGLFVLSWKMLGFKKALSAVLSGVLITILVLIAINLIKD